MSRISLFAIVLLGGALLLALSLSNPVGAQTSGLTPKEQLGKFLFYDESLSAGGIQSCATCHDPSVGFTGPDSDINAHGAVYEGAIPGRFGNRKPPSAAYAGDSLALIYDQNLGAWVGGMFWDGRADGSELGDPLAEQAKGPFLNPLEQALASPQDLCNKVAAGSYAALFDQVWGTGSLDCATKAGQVYDQIGISIAAYERSAEVNPYTSKFDAFWDKAKKKRLDVTKITAGNRSKYRGLGLTDTELYGLALFNDPAKANCASCHSLQPGSKGYPLFTDFTYDNIGVPKNPENPFYDMPAEFNPDGAAWVDYGLGAYLMGQGYLEGVYAIERGKMKVPTLRNVDKRPATGFVKAYGHNGYFKSLAEIVSFYRCRSMGMGGGGMGGGGMGGGGGGGCCSMCGQAEVPANLADLTANFCRRDEGYIVAFLKTLSDGYFQRP